MAKNRKSFKTFVKGTQAVLKDLRDAKLADTNEAKRVLHTIKGNASLFYMRDLVGAVHEVETEVKDKGLDIGINQLEFLVLAQELFAALNRELHQITLVLGDVGLDDNKKPVDADVLEEVAYDIVQSLGEDSPIYKKYMESFVLSNFAEAFDPYELKIHQIALKQEKPIEFGIFNEVPIFVHLPYYEDFISSLIHVFTNAIIHGIEDEKVRILNGKSTRGEVSVHVRLNSEGAIEIQIDDDGSGVDEKRVKEKAVSLGLLTKKEAKTISAEEVHQFLFADDFSTFGEVTKLAGRGVGLAAVRGEVEKLGGECKIISKPKQGTIFMFTIPVIHYVIEKPEEDLFELSA